MKIGVKFGLDNWKLVLSSVTPECAEVWFRLDWKNQFDEMFGELRNRKIPFGLHYWAVIGENIEPNLVYEPEGIAEKTEESMRETIDIASQKGASYVNIHPGAYCLRELNLDEKYMKTNLEKTISVAEGNASLEKRALSLREYAGSKNILFLVETLPKNELAHWQDATGRENIQGGNSVALEELEILGKKGIYLTNDFGHTVSQWTDLSKEELYSRLLDATKKLAPFTRLIHLNTVRAPFNGTDSHNGVLEEDFKLGVVPNREQLIELLNIFKDRDDVWIIPEPDAEKMVENFQEIIKFLP
jgi:endonuclease IV